MNSKNLPLATGKIIYFHIITANISTGLNPGFLGWEIERGGTESLERTEQQIFLTFNFNSAILASQTRPNMCVKCTSKIIPNKDHFQNGVHFATDILEEYQKEF